MDYLEPNAHAADRPRQIYLSVLGSHRQITRRCPQIPQSAARSRTPRDPYLSLARDRRFIANK
jgi:hypothetical protein